MQNLIIGYPNHIDAATLSGGSWNASFPRSNLQTPRLGQYAQSSTGSVTIDIDLGAAKSIGAFGAIATTLTTSATYRLRGASDSGFITVLYDSTTLTATTQTPNLIIGFTPVSARYWRLELSDSGAVKIGRLFIGGAFSPWLNYEFGSAFGYQDATGVERSIGGVDFFNTESPKRRAFKLRFNWLTEAEANAALSLQELVGISGEVLLVRDPAETTYNQRYNYLARLNELTPLEDPSAGLYQTAFELLEIVA